jgi:hypothetical protein
MPMPTITETLLSEHALLCSLFDEVDRLGPDVRTLPEVRLLSRLIEGVLARHADLEQDLAYAALDQALAEKGELKRLYQDHQEIDAHLHGAAVATEFAAAVRLLKAGLKASREHFLREERLVFPLFEKLLGRTALEALGAEASGSAEFSLGPHFVANALHARLRNYTGTTEPHG